MSKKSGIRRGATWASLATLLFVFGGGMTCPPGGDNGDGGGGTLPIGNTPPRILISSVTTPTGNSSAEQGQPVTIAFTGGDAEDQCTVRVFASQSSNPSSATPIITILSGFLLGPGQGAGSVIWNTTGVAIGTFYLFAEIDDQTFDPLVGSGNPPVRVTSASPVQIVPLGSTPRTSPPNVAFDDPSTSLALSTGDDVTVRYRYLDPDSSATVTLILDKDQIPTNDDPNNPGDPQSANIIVLPSRPPEPGDPTFPNQNDTDQIRTNPRTFGSSQAFIQKTYRFTIDLSLIPQSSQPYYVRATITDGTNVVHRYALGRISVVGLASGIVDVANLGFTYAGARFQGFSERENLGTAFVPVDDIDGDFVDDFMIASRYGRPRNRLFPGAAYLLFGRRKTPFPPDTNGNGLPDSVDPDTGLVVDYPAPPDYVPNPYDSANAGRFGNIINANEVGARHRGTIYAMPSPITTSLPPEQLQDPGHPGLATAGLTSITRFDMNEDDVPDLIFGLPFTSSARDHVDDDPAEGACGVAYDAGADALPNAGRCDRNQNDDLVTGFDIVDQGMVIMVDGTNDINTIFPTSVDAGLAGQFDPSGGTDDEGITWPGNRIPRGTRLRGGWINRDQLTGINSTDEFGHTISGISDVDGDGGGELLVSAPGDFNELGRVDLWRTNNYLADRWYDNQPVFSLPVYAGQCPGGSCFQPPNPPPPQPTPPTECIRCFLVSPLPAFNSIFGSTEGDRFGFANAAGDFNADGVADIAAGAPGANRQAVDPATGNPTGPTLSNNGVSYVILVPSAGFGNLSVNSFSTRVDIIGSHDDDQFGFKQVGIRSMIGAAASDVAVSAALYDDAGIGADVGFVGVIFGDSQIQGARGFVPEQIGTAALPGVRFIGNNPGDRAGFDIASAGDFNTDGFGDLLISAPGERPQGSKLGAAYVIFGGPHLNPAVTGNLINSFSLSQVGSPELPGIVLRGRISTGAEPAPPIGAAPNMIAAIETVGGLGDVDGDGFDDIMVGAPGVDFVNPNIPSQRRIDAGEAYLVYGNNFGTNCLGNIPGYVQQLPPCD